MTYAVIADVHGNLEALRAVLAAIDRCDVGRTVCLGDVVGYNAEPNECAALLVERGIQTIAGNHDLIAVGRLGFDRCADKPAFTLRRTRKALSDACRAYLSALPAWLPLEADVALIHGGVNDPQEYVTTRERVLDNAGRLTRLAPSARVCFFGHTHEQKLFEVRQGEVTERPARGTATLDRNDSVYFVNPGSVDASRKAEPRVAEYAIFDSTTRTLEFSAVTYDAALVERRAAAHGFRMTPTDERLYRLRRRFRRLGAGVTRRLGLGPRRSGA